MSSEAVPLVLWAANVRSHDVLARADAVVAGGFASMSLFTEDVRRFQRRSQWSAAKLGVELKRRGAPATAVDPYLGWYPGWDPDAISNEAGDLLRTSEEEILAMAVDLGATYITLVAPWEGREASLEEVLDHLGGFVDRAGALGLRPHLAPVPATRAPDLASALSLVEAVGRENLGLLLDTYNLGRGDLDPAELDAVPLDRIFQIQLADASREPVGSDYHADALHHRLLPGDGELGMAEMIGRLAARGPLAPIGPEVFSDELDKLSAAEAGILCGEKTRSFLSSIPAGHFSPAQTRESR